MNDPHAATDWHFFLGNGTPHEGIERLPDPPPWRPFRSIDVPRERTLPRADQLAPATQQRGRTFQATPQIVEIVNAALVLRRPLLVTGHPGSGKSSLVDAIAYELNLGEPLRWSVTSRSTLRDALYSYDAVGRLQASQQAAQDDRRAEAIRHYRRRGAGVPITDYLRLGPLGTALLPTARPRALLVDEIDKADLDLPNDLLNVLEEGEYLIPELERLEQQQVDVRVQGGADGETYPVVQGRVRARQFPVVVFTSNGEREFPPAFKRRCLSLDMPDPCADVDRLTAVVRAHLAEYFDDARRDEVNALIKAFADRAATQRLATDQLLNAVLLVVGRSGLPEVRKAEIVQAVTRPLA